MIKSTNDKKLVAEAFEKLQVKKLRSNSTNEIKAFLYEEIVVKKSTCVKLESDKQFRHYPVTCFLRDELKIDREKFGFNTAPKSAYATEIVVNL